MSNATELLNGLTDDQVAAYSVNPDTEEHIVIGSNRIITVPAALKKIAVEHDHNVETVTFDCPRYWDGHDMSKWQVYINYILSNGYSDSYPADNVEVDATDETVMHFSWTISRNVTQVKGAITILVCIKETDEEGNEIRHWNSERNSELTVSAGMECAEKVADEHPDIVNQLLSRMNDAEDVAEDAKTLAEEAKTLAEEVAQRPSGGGSGLPEVTEADNGKIPMVVGGQWENVKFPAGTQYDSTTATISAGDWMANDYQIHAVWYGLQISVDGCDIDISLAASSTKEQFEEAARCGVYCSSAMGTELVFTALYDMPTIDLTFDIRITKPTTLSYSVDEESMTLTIMEGDSRYD
jgi:hypothetical protein